MLNWEPIRLRLDNFYHIRYSFIMQKAWIEDGVIVVKIGGDDFHRNLELVKGIAGRTFNPTTKLWAVPNTPISVQILHQNGFDLSADLAVDFVEQVDGSWENTEITIPPFYGQYSPYPFQIEALKYLKHHNNRGVLGLPMGSGKSILGITFIKSTEDSLPALIICPSPVKTGFVHDYKKFFGNTDDIEILYGMDALAKYKKKKIYVINYEILSRGVDKRTVKYRNKYGTLSDRIIKTPSRELERFIATGFKTVIADECHRLKNEDSNAFVAFKALATGAPYVIGMSGTPILSRPVELWSYWNTIKPGAIGSKTNFLNRYCSPRTINISRGRRITLYDGATNLLELNHKLRNNGMLIMEKKDILKDLPDEPVKTVVPLELDNYEKYEAEKELVLIEISNNRKLALTLFERLKQAAVKHKMDDIFSYIDNLLDVEQKVIVFAVHQKVVETLHKKYKNSVIFNGTVTAKKKDEAKEKFITDPETRLLIGNIHSLGVGVDGLQKSGASTILFVEFPWNPTDLDQAEARLWRDGFIGEKGINVHYLVGKGTIEEEIIDKLDSKKGVVEAVIKGTDVKEDDLLSFLMDKYMNEIIERKLA